MSKFEDLRTRPVKKTSSFGGLRTRPVRKIPQTEETPPVTVQEATGDSWPKLIGKAVLKGATSIADLPYTAVSALEGANNYLSRGKTQYLDNPLRNLFGLKSKELPEPTNYSSYIPNTGAARRLLKGTTGIDLEPRPSTAGQRIATNAIELVGGLVTGGAAGNLAKSGSMMQKFLGTTKGAKDVLKQATLGGTIGGTSGVLQEGGMGQLPADLASVALIGTGMGAGRGTRSLLDNFSPAKRQAKAEQKVSELLKNVTKDEGIDNILNYGTMPNKWGINPVTAEVASSRGFSNLHNAFAPNVPAIAERQALNDSIIRQELNKIGGGIEDISAYELGKLGREEVQKKLTRAKKNREKETAHLYKELEASEKLYPTREFNKYNKKAIKKEVGKNESKIREIRGILPKKYRGKIKVLQNELDELKKSPIVSSLDKFQELYGHLGPNAQKEIYNDLVKDGTHVRIQELEKELKNVRGKYTAGHIDKAITEIGNKINELKISTDRRNNKLIKYYTEQKEALTNDLMRTPEGVLHRNEYAKYSIPVKAIERDKLLKKYIQQNEFNEYRVPTDDLAPGILKAPTESIENYMRHIKGTAAEPATKAYFRNQYMGKAAENALPTYDKSNQFLKKNKLKKIFTPAEYNKFLEVNNYLRNRDMVNQAGRASGSPTATRQNFISTIVEPQIGKKYNKIPFATTGAKWALSRVPYVGNKLGDLIGNKLVYENPTYSVLENALLNPEEAKRILSQQRVTPSKQNRLLPLLPAIANRNITAEDRWPSR